MKKLLFVYIILFVFLGQACARNNILSDTVNRCISMLGKPVPDGFWRIDRTMFTNDEGLILAVENGIVISVTLWNVFESFNEAHKENGKLYGYFENPHNNWDLFYSTDEGDSYFRNGIYATIAKPSRRDDGKIFIGSVFCRDF